MSFEIETDDPAPASLGGRRCLFCNVELTQRSQSREHVVPQWLAEHMGISNKASGHTTMVWDEAHSTYRPEIDREHPVSAHLEGRICVDCNTGWMSRLEAAVQPILTPLVDGNADWSSYTACDKLTLARWMLKTAYMLNSSSPGAWTIHPCDLHHLAVNDGGMPDWLEIHLLHCAWPEPISWFQWDRWDMMLRATTLPGSPILRGQTHEGFKIAMQFGQFAFLLSHFPHDDFSPLCWPKVHSPFWLPGGRVGRYEGSTSLAEHVTTCHTPIWDISDALCMIQTDLIPADDSCFDIDQCLGGEELAAMEARRPSSGGQLDPKPSS